MRLVLSEYLRTLRERDEFDRLLPELVTEMGYVPLFRPQTGTRQFGVDFAAAGKSPDDGVDELLLFVLKQGDIGRRAWHGDANAVQPSVEEIFDVYLRSHVPSGYEHHRKVIVVATTGDLKQDVQPNWSGLTSRHPEAKFELWGADRVADLLERYMLNEHLFDEADRSDLRRSLALASDPEYQFGDFCRLLLRQLGLDRLGALDERGKAHSVPDLTKAMQRVHLAARVCSFWADSEGEPRQALWVMERTILWCWHRASLQRAEEDGSVLQILWHIWGSHNEVAHRYFHAISPHVFVRDGLSASLLEGAVYALLVFEQIGLLATVGIAQTLTEVDEVDRNRAADNARVVADALATLLKNHPTSGSPRLDSHVIDVALGLTLFIVTDRIEHARTWLTELAGRFDFALRLDSLFPVGTDSLDDLVQLDTGEWEDDKQRDEFKNRMKQTSWMLATIASWCAVLGLDDAYQLLAEGHASAYPEVGGQLWHPSPGWTAHWYFGPAHIEDGATEAPYDLPETAAQLRGRIATFLEGGGDQWTQRSATRRVGLSAIDFVACRHFRTPVPAAVWYRISTGNLARLEQGS